MHTHLDLTRQEYKVKKSAVYVCSGVGFSQLLRAGSRWLETHLDQVNRANVFPVPDGDTGVNMLLTMRAALKAVDQAGGRRVETIAAAAAEGALLGARGNSGVILSQFLSGLADGLAGLAVFTAAQLAQALSLGAERAYHSVVEPVEGTMLTVARAAAEAARRSAQHNRDLFIVWTDIVVAAAAAQANTPELLPVLKQAGVTDSGGQGLLYLLEGGLRLPLSLMDEAQVVSAANSPSAGAQAQASPCGRVGPAVSPEQSVSKLEAVTLAGSTNGPDYGCDVQFLVYGRCLDLERMRADLELMGQSILVVGDERLARVHAHVTDPLLPLRYGAGLGLVADIVVEDMAAQARSWANRDTSGSSPLNLLTPPASKPITTLAVAPGPGFVELLQRLGVDQVLLRDPRLPLADEALLDCLSRIQAGSLLAAPESLETGALLRRLQLPAGQKLAVLPTQTIAQALAAMLAFTDRLDLDANIARMSRAGRQVHTLEIGPAEREVIPELLAQTELAAYEIAAIYVGQDSSLEQAGVLGRQIQALCPDLEIELYHGGQPHADYIISLE